jgi:hemerythrin-like domain-containing protein
MAEENILNLMVAHHALLDALFSLFRDQIKDGSPNAKSSLAELRWETKKHFFVEENAIFDFVTMESYGVLSTINQLKDEHITMLNDLKMFSEKFPGIKSEEMDNFHNLLENHRVLEEKDLYPRLDKELSNEQKKEIVNKINEIPLTK